MILMHGAGSNANAPLLIAVANELARFGVLVFRGDLPFRQARGSGPPRPTDAQKDREGIRQAIDAIKVIAPKAPMLAGGHSYGGRQTTMLAAEDSTIANALLLLSYPLHPPDKPDQLRTQHFPQLRTPSFFVHGTKDSFGTIEEFAEALKLIPATTQLTALAGAGHDLGTQGKKAAFARTFLDFAKVTL
jgi:predicted alpha/beta-hydrolase family hydrolase